MYFVHQKSMEVILSLGSLTAFEKKIVATVIELKLVCQTSAVVVVFFSFLKRACAFFLTCSLTDRCQSVTDTCKKMF